VELALLLGVDLPKVLLKRRMLVLRRNVDWLGRRLKHMLLD
jgi:hypothetical protein